MFFWQMISLQNSSALYTELMYIVYDLAMIITILIVSLILYLMISIITNKISNRFLLQGHLIEIIWTVIPMFILFKLAIPSIKLLYLLDETWNPIHQTIKTIGHQWYWSYEYSNYNNLKFDSYMINMSFDNEWFRHLDVDNRLIICSYFPTRMIISSADVIHSWAVPALGIKVDAIPGRTNQSMLLSLHNGLFFGQCSEICGTNHSFMPIVVESINIKQFNSWIKNLN